MPPWARNVELTTEAMEAIGDFYAELRGASDVRALPVTVRLAWHKASFSALIEAWLHL